MSLNATDPLVRWRLILGDAASEALPTEDTTVAGCDAALDWLYGREHDGPSFTDPADGGEVGRGPSQLTVPEWISEIHRLFPKETIERLEQDAIERYEIQEVVTNPEVLASVEPSPALLRAVLQTKHLMNPAVLAQARQLVAKVVQQILEELAEPIRSRLHGVVRRQHSSAHAAGPLDFPRTIRKNLRRWDPDKKKLNVERPYFFEREERRLDTWQIILLVDQSGSMLNSAIHSAVTASCLYGLPRIQTHLVLWDTAIVDLSGQLSDPVETLMKVQLGGGNDAARALAYGRSLITAPTRAIVVLITDFYEGTGAAAMLREIRRLVSQGTLVLGLAALDPEAVPRYDRVVAARAADAGAKVGAMTPAELAGFLAEAMRR